MEDRDLVLMVPAMAMDTDMVEGMATDTGLVPDTVMDMVVAATLGAVEVAGPKEPAPDLWSPPASATVRAKTPKWRIG